MLIDERKRPCSSKLKMKRQSLNATSIFEYRAFGAEQRNANVAATAAATEGYQDPCTLMTPEELRRNNEDITGQSTFSFLSFYLSVFVSRQASLCDCVCDCVCVTVFV